MIKPTSETIESIITIIEGLDDLQTLELIREYTQARYSVVAKRQRLRSIPNGKHVRSSYNTALHIDEYLDRNRKEPHEQASGPKDAQG